jgi:hypothetical protein
MSRLNDSALLCSVLTLPKSIARFLSLLKNACCLIDSKELAVAAG